MANTNARRTRWRGGGGGGGGGASTNGGTFSAELFFSLLFARIAFAFWRRLRRARRRHSRTRASHYIEPARIAPFARSHREVRAHRGAQHRRARAHRPRHPALLAPLAPRRRLAPPTRTPTRTPTRHRLSVRALTTPPTVDAVVVVVRAHTQVVAQKAHPVAPRELQRAPTPRPPPTSRAPGADRRRVTRARRTRAPCARTPRREPPTSGAIDADVIHFLVRPP